MTDLVERLRDRHAEYGNPFGLLDEAADEIDRLRKALAPFDFIATLLSKAHLGNAGDEELVNVPFGDIRRASVALRNSV